MKTAAVCFAAVGITLVVVNYFIYYFAATLVPHFSYAASLAFGMAFAFTTAIDTRMYNVNAFRCKLVSAIILVALMAWQFGQGATNTQIT